MTIEYYRDLSVTDEVIISTSQGIHAVDLNSFSIGSFKQIDKVPGTAVRIGSSDVGRLLAAACTRSIRRCEEAIDKEAE